MIFVTLKENSSLVHETVVPHQLNTANSKVNTNIARVQNQKADFIYNRYYLTTISYSWG